MSTPPMQPTPALTLLNYAKGGVGNQLFQHVFAHSLARKLHATVVTDVSYFGADPYGRNACVWNLAAEAQCATVAELSGPGSYMLQDAGLQSLQEPLSLPADARVLVLSGYWQRESLLDPVVVRDTYAQLCERVAPRVDADLRARVQGCAHAVAVHVRRKDYAHMGLCKESYYCAAIAHIQKHYADAELFVFTDEPNYVRHWMQQRGLHFTVVDSGSDMGDLYLMSLCKHFVIANSSFSWWAAYWGEAQGGLIICPQEWVTIDATPSPCPARWIQVPHAVQPFVFDADDLAAKCQFLGARG